MARLHIGMMMGFFAIFAVHAKGLKEGTSQQFAGGHDGLSWRGALADGLMNLLGVQSRPLRWRDMITK